MKKKKIEVTKYFNIFNQISHQYNSADSPPIVALTHHNSISLTMHHMSQSLLCAPFYTILVRFLIVFIVTSQTEHFIHLPSPDPKSTDLGYLRVSVLHVVSQRSCDTSVTAHSKDLFSHTSCIFSAFLL